MIKLRIKLALFNLLSKLFFTGLFLIFMPWLIERINLIRVDYELIQKREKVINLISRLGIGPFITSDSANVFGSFNILKEEFISLERINPDQDVNFIEVTRRIIDGEEIAYRVLNYSFKVDGATYLLDVGKSLESILNAQKSITKVMVVFLVFIILITFITDLQYTRRLLRPLDRITNKLKDISNPSTFDKTPVSTTTSDFISLDNSLSELMTRINDLFQKEKEITVNISHELLTPVSVLRGKLENLLLQKDLHPGISVKIEESLKTLHRLQSMINSLLLIARIESRQYLRDESFPVSGVLKEIYSEINPIAEDAGILLRVEIEQDFQFAAANRSLIFSMFYNIVNNAVKNTSAGGEVIIKSLHPKNKFTVTVSDTGKGMTEAQISSLFSRFRSSAGPESKGTGIGLAISKSIADFHGIDISVTSIVQEGTIFSFSFPENS